MHNITCQELIALRKATRTVAQSQSARLRDFLNILKPLANPFAVLGDTITSGSKAASPKHAKAATELLGLLRRVASEKPFEDEKELAPPFDITCSSIELHSWQYHHTIGSADNVKVITVSSPLKWIMSYPNSGPNALREALARREDVQRLLVQNVLLNFVLTQHTGMIRILEELHFSISTATLPEFGSLPLTCAGLAVSTQRPPDNVILEMVEFSGIDQSEEVLDPIELPNLSDPFRECILAATNGSVTRNDEKPAP